METGVTIYNTFKKINIAQQQMTVINFAYLITFDTNSNMTLRYFFFLNSQQLDVIWQLAIQYYGHKLMFEVNLY